MNAEYYQLTDEEKETIPVRIHWTAPTGYKGHGDLIPLNVARACVKEMNAKFPEIKHEIQPMTEKECDDWMWKHRTFLMAQIAIVGAAVNQSNK